MNIVRLSMESWGHIVPGPGGAVSGRVSFVFTSGSETVGLGVGGILAQHSSNPGFHSQHPTF